MKVKVKNMEKVQCPKCRRILFRYESNLKEGSINLKIECPDCKTETNVNLDTQLEQNYKIRNQ